MSTNPVTVSVIIPTYNRLEALKEAIASVKSQSFNDYDIWVVDDGSTDGTKEYLCELAASDEKFFVLLNSENKGVSFSRNRGIESSRGEWLAFLDSDDQWLPQKLELQMQYAFGSPHIPLIHTEEIWIRNGVRVNPSAKYKKLGGQIFDQCFEQCRISPSTSMIRRSLFESLGLFREDFPVCEDFEFWLRVTRNYDVGFLSQPLSIKHGGHEDQLSRKFHSMDYWRVLALNRYLPDDLIEPKTQQKLRETLVQKCEILIKGYIKHQNHTDLAEVTAILKNAQGVNHDRIH